MRTFEIKYGIIRQTGYQMARFLRHFPHAAAFLSAYAAFSTALQHLDLDRLPKLVAIRPIMYIS